MIATDIRTPPLGSLRDRVEIRRRDVVVEDDGGEVTTFFPVATVWARVRELSARPSQAVDGRGVGITTR